MHDEAWILQHVQKQSFEKSSEKLAVQTQLHCNKVNPHFRDG